MDKIFENLTLADMPTNDLKLVAETCGIDTAMSLLKNLSGVSLYIPKLERTDLVKNYIIKSFNGSSECAKRLALELGLSVNHIYNVIKKSNKPIKIDN